MDDYAGICSLMSVSPASPLCRFGPPIIHAEHQYTICARLSFHLITGQNRTLNLKRMPNKWMEMGTASCWPTKERPGHLASILRHRKCYRGRFQGGIYGWVLICIPPWFNSPSPSRPHVRHRLISHVPSNQQRFLSPFPRPSTVHTSHLRLQVRYW